MRAKPLFSISVGGLCSWYPNNSQVPNIHRVTLGRIRKTIELYNGYRYVDEAVFFN